ncbi:hypothetical protein niasHS_001552 [Heterodera schachtii]|uniref:Phosphoinositide phospholipase C n=1 Tax=Heterodera schachtii TaxID=97005 RepID=A0ABD2KDR8_HETSC
MAPSPVGAGDENYCGKGNENGKCHPQPLPLAKNGKSGGDFLVKGAAENGKMTTNKGIMNSCGESADDQHTSAFDFRNFSAMEKGHRVCKLFVLKKFDVFFRHLWLNLHTHQLVLTKLASSSASNDEPVASTSSASVSTSSDHFLPNGLLANSGRKGSVLSAELAFCSPSAKSQMLDLRIVKEAQVLSKAIGTMQIAEKWRRDTSLQTFDPELILIIQWGTAFVLNSWLILFNTKEACQLWCRGLQQLCAVGDPSADQSHALVVERWLRKRFLALLPHPTSAASVNIKHMKPFVQQRLQCKVSSKQLQEIAEGEMGFEAFVLAHNRLLNFHALFDCMFSEYADTEHAQLVPFQRFVDFLRDIQHDGLGQSRQFVSDFLRRYLRDVDPDRDVPEPSLNTDEFVEYLYSPENSLFDPVNYEVVHDMQKPLNHYWISSSHNTYLTGDQLRSESSLDAYARALLMGCRCVELDCWDGPQLKQPQQANVVVIYHGYTMTTKLQLRDVLRTIRAYAFRSSEFPLILSIEDNCSLPAQRQMATDIKQMLGDLLLTAPVSRDEWQLPSPAALKRKIILKHKKLQLHNELTDAMLSAQSAEEEMEQDNILSRQCVKKGVLWLREDGGNGTNGAKSCGGSRRSSSANANGGWGEQPKDKQQGQDQQGHQWHKHIFGRAFFGEGGTFGAGGASLGPSTATAGAIGANEGTDEQPPHPQDGTAEANGRRKHLAGREDSLNSQSDDTFSEADACADAHVAEEWFHGKVGRDEAKARLLQAARHSSNSGGGGGSSGSTTDGLFLVRESTTFIGDFTLSFLHSGCVHHCRIKASISTGGERKYHLLDSVKRDTLYELISFYTHNALDTPNFKTFLQTPCPQPQPHLDKPWFSASADTEQAEKLLNAVPMDGAFMVRYSTTDKTVFVVSLRIDNNLCHFRLKREGRLFMVAQRTFETLCHLVDFYASTPFVRGVSLKFPVNEQTISQYTDQNGGQLQLDGFYIDLNNLEKELRVEAIESFDGIVDDCQMLKSDQLKAFPPLSFPIGTQITLLSMDQNDHNIVGDEQQHIWVGRYNEKTGWFPAKCVRKLTATNGGTTDGNNMLNYGTIELSGTTFKQCSSDSSADHPVEDDHSRRGRRPFAFRVTLAPSHWDVCDYVLAANSREEMDEWVNACQQMAAEASNKMRQLRSREKQSRIASELSSLVIYCQAVPFHADFELQDPRSSFYEMCSFSESKHDKLVERGLQLFNKRQLSRVYPQASRFTSTNFNPVPMWNSGCHMVALNFQTGDKSMQLNTGRFMANGRCGFVLKPLYLMDETFSINARDNHNHSQQLQHQHHHQLQRPALSSSTFENVPSSSSNDGTACDKLTGERDDMPTKLIVDDEQKQRQKMSTGNGTFATAALPSNAFNHQNQQQKNAGVGCPIVLTVLVVAGRHLSRIGACDKGGGICSPCVELELLGFPHDARLMRTNTITSNGLNPIWQERFVFHVRHPEMALLRFHVEDGDFVGPKTDPFIGQAVFPLDSVRCGFRSVPLRNQFSEPLELSALLVHVEIRAWDPPPMHGRLGLAASLGRRHNTNTLPTNSSAADFGTINLGHHNTLNAGKSAASDKALQQCAVGPLIQNPHKMLQAGRSILAQQPDAVSDGIFSPAAAPFGTADGTDHSFGQNWPSMPGPLNRRNASIDQIRLGSSTSQTAAAHQQQQNIALSTRSISVESGDIVKSSVPSSGQRKAGTKTLRRIFRLGGGKHN